jgi:hypothetical protein
MYQFVFICSITYNQSSKQQQQQQEQKQPGSCFFTFVEAFPKLPMWVFGGHCIFLNIPQIKRERRGILHLTLSYNWDSSLLLTPTLKLKVKGSYAYSLRVKGSYAYSLRVKGSYAYSLRVKGSYTHSYDNSLRVRGGFLCPFLRVKSSYVHSWAKSSYAYFKNGLGLKSGAFLCLFLCMLLKNGQVLTPTL